MPQNNTMEIQDVQTWFLCKLVCVGWNVNDMSVGQTGPVHRTDAPKMGIGPAKFLYFWEIQTGAHKRGLSPKFSEKIGQKSFRENRAFSGLIGAFSGPIGAFSGLIGTDSSAHHSRGEAAEIPPKGPFWAQLAPFGLSPRLAEIPPKGPFWAQLAPFGLSPRLLSPRLDFPYMFIRC